MATPRWRPSTLRRPGLFFGMMIARRVGHHFEFLAKDARVYRLGIAAPGILFALIGVMPNFGPACCCCSSAE